MLECWPIIFATWTKQPTLERTIVWRTKNSWTSWKQGYQNRLDEAFVQQLKCVLMMLAKTIKSFVIKLFSSENSTLPSQHPHNELQIFINSLWMVTLSSFNNWLNWDRLVNWKVFYNWLIMKCWLISYLSSIFVPLIEFYRLSFTVVISLSVSTSSGLCWEVRWLDVVAKKPCLAPAGKDYVQSVGY